jgi:hypothetical protein
LTSRAKSIVFVLSNVEPFLVKPFLIDKTQPPKLLKVWWFFALSGRELFKSSRGKAYKPLTFSFLLNREMDGGDFDALWGPIGE